IQIDCYRLTCSRQALSLLNPELHRSDVILLASGESVHVKSTPVMSLKARTTGHRAARDNVLARGLGNRRWTTSARRCCRTRGWRYRWRGCGRNPAAGSDAYVIQVKVRGRVEEYELQVSVISGHHIGKGILRIPEGALSRLRYEDNTTNRSPKTIVSRVV